MSGCKIKRNLVGSAAATGASTASADKNCSTEVDAKLAAMMAEREKQDKDLNKVMTEEEYEVKYGKQPVGGVKPK